ncbi:hypothetical protein [Actinoallomurus iriomotensis]|uniref:Uncharacterized protein n=1 Tax=Actinoallomurus iriomotensis TaxID=478107 RepID=A0A9W6W560_9ACTN|nr:hypothetical protein [Actinoallomurus iriomotensis]GLY91164.1 hypothetical protein Airi02_090930 [Actinoallomurus iriomotensis]
MIGEDKVTVVTGWKQGQSGPPPAQGPYGRGTAPDHFARHPAGASPGRRRFPPTVLRLRGRGFWGTVGRVLLLIILLPFLALYGVYWVVTFLLTPVLFALHLVFWPLGCLWAGICRACGARRDARWRILRPIPPAFPAIWRLSYWFTLRRSISAIVMIVSDGVS